MEIWRSVRGEREPTSHKVPPRTTECLLHCVEHTARLLTGDLISSKGYVAMGSCPEISLILPLTPSPRGSLPDKTMGGFSHCCQLGANTLMDGVLLYRIKFMIGTDDWYMTRSLSGPNTCVWASVGGSGPSSLYIYYALAECLLPVPTTRSSTGLALLAPKERTLPREDTAAVLLNWTVRLPPGHSGIFVPRNQWTSGGEDYFLGWLASVTKGNKVTATQWNTRPATRRILWSTSQSFCVQ